MQTTDDACAYIVKPCETHKLLYDGIFNVQVEGNKRKENKKKISYIKDYTKKFCAK